MTLNSRTDLTLFFDFGCTVLRSLDISISIVDATNCVLSQPHRFVNHCSTKMKRMALFSNDHPAVREQ